MISNPVGEFVLGKALSSANNTAATVAKRTLQHNAPTYSNQLIMESWKNYNALHEFSAAAEESILDFVRLSHHLNHDEKLAGYKSIIRSEFFKPPSSTVFPATKTNNNSPSLADRIELSFYLKLILETDHLVTLRRWKGHHRTVRVGSTPITTRPSSAHYPSTHGRRGSGNAAIFDRTKVEFGDVGQIILDRVNKLYQKTFTKKSAFVDSLFFGETMNQNALKRAEEALIELGGDSNLTSQNSGGRTYLITDSLVA